MFDFEVSLPQPYKLCDFKPAYGEVFRDLLKEYDFWGHCDDDLIFGDIRRFVSDDILNRYDRILGHGHFSLFRNTEKVAQMYKKAKPSYREVFSRPESFCFDEYPGTSRYWKDYLKDRFYDDAIFDDIACMKYNFYAVHKKVHDKGCTKFVYAFEDGKLWRVFEKDGKVCKEETMYVHFQKRMLKVETPVSDKFIIVPNSIVAYDIIDNAYLDCHASKRYFYPTYFTIMWSRAKRKMERIIKTKVVR